MTGSCGFQNEEREREWNRFKKIKKKKKKKIIRKRSYVTMSWVSK